jgi:hypothetical protein
LIFSGGDSDENINISNSLVFRTSQYRYKVRKNEIIMPPIADDLLGDRTLEFREKSEKAIVGFCGWASILDMSRAIKEYLKLSRLILKSFNDKKALLHKRGLLFRIEAIKYLSRSSLVKTNFIIRKSFSGNEKTIELDPAQAREEYIKNIEESDFSLAIKGDGNYSIRFYEILSLGRIPVLINTDCILPNEDIIDYSKFVLKVDYRNINNLDAIISDFHKKMSKDDFFTMQSSAREAYENHLRIDKYFDFVLKKEFLERF